MNVEIRIGNVTNDSPIIKWDSNSKFSDLELEKKRMYNFLINNNNCIIENVDMFLLYTLNNGILSYIVRDNYNNYNDNEKYDLLIKLNPLKYKIYEVSDSGLVCNIQDHKGIITINYFDKLMGEIMDDFYVSLNYLEESNK